MSALFLAALLAAGAGAGPDAAVGVWRSPTKNGVIDIRQCGSSLCGRLMDGDDIRRDPNFKDVNNKDAKLRDRPVKGITMLSGFTRTADNWDGGQVYNPADGRTYSGRITVVDHNTLKLRGCVFVPLCKTETWTRIR